MKIKETFQRWGGRSTLFFSYAHGSHDMCPALVAPLLPLIKAELGLNYLQSGILLSALTITIGFSQFLGGWLGDRYNRWLVIGMGLSGIGAAMIAFGFTSTYMVMLVILVIMGVSSGAYHPCSITMLYSYSESANIGKTLGVHMVGGSIGFTLAPVIGGLIADKLSWHFSFIFLGIPL